MLASGAALTRSALASDRITVILDGNFLAFNEVQPQIINDRVMVPVRELGEALGAEVNWDPTTYSVLLTSGNRYATLRIDSPVMIFGTFTNVDGEMTATSAESLELQSPPVIVDERALFPLHAITYAFGIDQPGWDGATRVVTIISATTPIFPGLATPPAADPETNGSGTVVHQTPNVIAPLIPNSEFFMEVSGNTLQGMHDNRRNRFAAVVFDGNSQANLVEVQRVINAANTAEFRVHGFDINNATGRFSNPALATWIWELEGADRYGVPFVVLSFAGQQDYLVKDLSDQGALVDMLSNIALQNPRLPGPTPTPTPSPSPYPSPGASPSPSPSPGADRQFSWDRIELTRTQTMYDNNESFAVLIYSTTDHNVMEIRDMVEGLARANNVPMYFASNVGNISWIERYSGFNQALQTPAVFIVEGRNTVRFRLGITNASRSAIDSYLWSFRRHLNNLSN